jgi:hypothetical protein
VTIPDPAHPKVRDAFITDHGERTTIATVGKAWVLVHYPNGVESPVSRTLLATWTPAPPPLITEDVTLYVHDAETIVMSGPCSDCRPFVIHPDHTWTEVAT